MLKSETKFWVIPTFAARKGCSGGSGLDLRKSFGMIPGGKMGQVGQSADPHVPPLDPQDLIADPAHTIQWSSAPPWFNFWITPIAARTTRTVWCSQLDRRFWWVRPSICATRDPGMGQVGQSTDPHVPRLENRPRVSQMIRGSGELEPRKFGLGFRTVQHGRTPQTEPNETASVVHRSHPNGVEPETAETRPETAE